MAAAAGAVREEDPTLLRLRREAGASALRARGRARERSDIGRERIEIGGEPGLRIAERLRPRAGRERRIADQPTAARERAALTLEVLDLVEVARPGPRALA